MLSSRFTIPVKVAHNLDVLLEIGAGGVAANELVDGIPRDRNPGASGDMRQAGKLMDAAGIPPRERMTLWNAAVVSRRVYFASTSR